MRNSTARQILAETPSETRQFVLRYGEIVTRIYDLLKEKGWSQKHLAEKLDKRPSEISKWLSGEHNFTLRSLAKLEVELGENLIQVPRLHGFQVHSQNVVHIPYTRRNKEKSFVGTKKFKSFKFERTESSIASAA
jgi:transcriptional regulator with XRE-family HTH domain